MPRCHEQSGPGLKELRVRGTRREGKEGEGRGGAKQGTKLSLARRWTWAYLQTGAFGPGTVTDGRICMSVQYTYLEGSAQGGG